VLAPILGITSDANRSEGSLVSPKENSLFSKIVQLDPIQINFEISDKEVNVFIYQSDDSLHSYVGRLTLFDPMIDPKTGTFPLQAYFLNPDNLLKMIERIANHYITVDVLAIGKRWCRTVWPR
jgi:multidrug efflux pump subunit AcrA (membrane-fusion protein)